MRPFFLVNPRFEAVLHQNGLRTPSDFISCGDGVAVGRHAHRQVRRISVGEATIYLKREEPVCWKDQLYSWLTGFGWVSKSSREWQVLVKLRGRGIPAPEPLAVGEVGAFAFLAVKGFSDSCDLPTFLAFKPDQEERNVVLRNLGHTIADMHAQGITHPDLYAKHVFIHRPTLNVALVDFQRTRFLTSVSWSRRCCELARLDASLHPGAVPFKERLTFLHAYLHRALGHVSRRQVRDAATQITAESRRLLCRRRIQAMYAETAMLSGDVSIVTYCRVRVPENLSLGRAAAAHPQVLRGNRV